MNEIREIVTKAVVAKGKKIVNLHETIKISDIPESILGCLVINHTFNAKKTDFDISLNGSFELDIWYSAKDNTKTNIIKKNIDYAQSINTKRILSSQINQNNDCIVKMLQHPTCTNAIIENDECIVDVMFEVLVDVIGEVTMQVNIIDPVMLEDDDITSEIDEDFLNK